jgi:hydroxyethylthiazole kinase
MQPAAINCPGTTIPEGSFPVSLKLGWHGGSHLHAPSMGQTPLPVRCVADGEIVFARRPVAFSNDVTHPQNYNPYGTSPAWTDNGMVIVRHVTDIGTGADAKGIVFYSLVTHLSELSGNSLKVANKSATDAQRHLSRKDLIGVAGRVYGAAEHIHMEIVCDDANLGRLVGRRTGAVDLAANGRSDAIYGEVYFVLPIGTNFYHDRPADGARTPSGALSTTLTEPLIVGIRYCSGDGDRAGDAYLTSYSSTGSIIGNAPVREPDAEYNLLVRATAIKTSYEQINGAIGPTPSALYELLRFGRIIGPDALDPLDTPHWRRANHSSGVGWVNLNSADVTKYSDADLPQWKGWTLIDDDSDDDSRCNSETLFNLIGKASTAANEVRRAEIIRHLSVPAARAALTGVIAKFPSEWNRDTIDARWGWLQVDKELGLGADDWTVFREHIKTLTVATVDLPEELRSAHWHFHPHRIIEHLRNCSWLSEGEMAQTLPKYLFYSQTGNPRSAITADSSIYTLTRSEATRRLARHHVSLNQCLRRYIGPSRQRIAMFLAQVLLETAQWRDQGGMCRLMHEWFYGQPSTANPATVHYSAFYGRGIMQLTWAGNYKSYGDFRRLPNHTGTYAERLTPSLPRITAQSHHYLASPDDNGTLITWSPRFDPDIVGEDPYAACDSGGHYWISKHFSGHSNLNRACDQVFSPVSVGLVNHLVNGGGNGYYERQAYSLYLMRILTEDTSVDTVRQVAMPAPRSGIHVNFSRT